MTTIQERESMEAMAAGNQQAFSYLYLQYYPKVKMFISKLLQNDELAKDLSQDIFIKLWQNRAAIKNIANLNAYIFTMARNSVYQHVRHCNITREHDEKEQLVVASEKYVQNTTEEQINLSEMEHLIKVVVEHMPKKRKLIFQMSRIHGFSLEQIALFLGISKRTVENHLTKALADLKKVLLTLSTLFL